MRFIKLLLFFSLMCTIIIYLLPRTWELDLIASVQGKESDASVRFFQFVSDSKSFITVGIPVLLVIMSLIRSDKQLREKGLIILFTLAVAGILSIGIKKIVREPRPYEVDTRITQLSGGGGFGFPSGHTLEVVAAATAFSFFWPELLIIVSCVIWVLLTMVSRIYLGVHDPGDVMGGMFLGLLSFVIVIKFRDYLYPSRSATPSE